MYLQPVPVSGRGGGGDLEVTFHEMDAVVCLPRVNAEQKELGGKEALVYTAVLGGVS